MYVMISKTLKDTENIAQTFLNKLHPHASTATIVALSGDLGSGKTTFTKSFAKALGISEDNITSPTFVIEKRFDIGNHHHFKKFIHIDAYRLEKPEEIERLDWKETIFDRGNLVFVEWPEHIGGALPKDAIKISFKFVDENTREITF
jgi:tRNA threonylcarbamoyladenosine biosynthesis protein TsaE